ncbi:MAG: hypothetical protein M5R42_05605 [Rhodocyclaceae bacterium]|nr:hypothetical protein [Rhodocyclaceae bacterium]
MRERGSDLTIFSPRASFMAHHIGDFNVSSAWAAICNELCFRVSNPTRHRVCQAGSDSSTSEQWRGGAYGRLLR